MPDAALKAQAQANVAAKIAAAKKRIGMDGGPPAAAFVDVD